MKFSIPRKSSASATALWCAATYLQRFQGTWWHAGNRNILNLSIKRYNYSAQELMD